MGCFAVVANIRELIRFTRASAAQSASVPFAASQVMPPPLNQDISQGAPIYTSTKSFVTSSAKEVLKDIIQILDWVCLHNILFQVLRKKRLIRVPKPLAHMLMRHIPIIMEYTLLIKRFLGFHTLTGCTGFIRKKKVALDCGG